MHFLFAAWCSVFRGVIDSYGDKRSVETSGERQAVNGSCTIHVCLPSLPYLNGKYCHDEMNTAYSSSVVVPRSTACEEARH